MEGEEVSKTLPEDLVGRILAMVPFPFILKARVLSKTWLARFSSISSQDDDEKKCLAASFQRQVGERSINWKTFCPFLMSWGCCGAYDRDSHNWSRVPSLLPFLPEHIFNDSSGHMEGALLLVCQHVSGGVEFYVANILTQSWKQLPTLPHMSASAVFVRTELVSHTSLKMYNVFVFLGLPGGGRLVEIYDSTSNAWSTKKFDGSMGYCHRTPLVYLNGFLYMIANSGPGDDLLAFNVKELTLEKSSFEALDNLFLEVRRGGRDLVACSSNLLMITHSHYMSFEGMLLWKVDLRSRGLLGISQGPPATLNVRKYIAKPVSDGDCIFWKVDHERGLQYDVKRDEWSVFPFPDERGLQYDVERDECFFPFPLESKFSRNGSLYQDGSYPFGYWAFHPGLNPFEEV